VRKGDDALRQALDKGLAEIVADGTYDRITAPYFPFSLRTESDDTPTQTTDTGPGFAMLPWLPELARGAAVTLELAFTSLAIGLVLGIGGAVAKLSEVGWVRIPVVTVTNLIRGVPEFLILLIVYFGASGWCGEDLAPGPFGAGVFALGHRVRRLCVRDVSRRFPGRAAGAA
jgi:His/Glu/Gln/Arg/opine family amino acid ABC transporter permease subunit